jgi:hypothetical protein
MTSFVPLHPPPLLLLLHLQTPQTVWLRQMTQMTGSTHAPLFLAFSHRNSVTKMKEHCLSGGHSHCH